MKLALRKAVSLLSILLFATIGILSAQPTFSSNPITTATVGVPYTYGVSATDPSNNTLNFSAITKPSWLTLNNNGQSSATQFGGTVSTPGGIAGDDAGNIYVTTLTNTSIYKIAPDGTTTLWFTREGGNVYGMYVYNNHLYVSYYYNSVGQRSKITKINLSNPAAGETDVLVSPSQYVYLSMTVYNGFMYIAAYGQGKVIKLNLATNAVSDVVTGISGPFGVGFNSAGLLYIASYGSSSIYTFNLTTSVLTQVITGIPNPSDVKIDAYDNVYISGNRYVRKYTPDLSSFITAYTATGFVWGMSITPTGALVFGDNAASRVAKLQTGASLTGTPTLADLGVNNVTLRVSNGTTTADQNFTITVYSAPTIASLPNVSRPLNQGPVTITNPTSNSNGAFTYTSSNPTVASVSGNTITLNTQGTTNIIATQAASGYYKAGADTFTVTVTAPVAAGPAGINNGIKMWLDASDIDGDGNTGNDPSSNASLNIWKDRSGLGNHATTVAGKSNINYVTNEVNGKSVARFTKINDQDGSVLEAAGVDIRAGVNPNVTIFTVYKSGAHPVIAGQGHALWGNDNQAWDRFFYNSWNFTDNGIVSLGPTGANFANITGSGTTGALRLMTAVYNHGVTGGSAIYFDGAAVTTFTDNTSATDAFDKLSIGRDGDNGTYNGDIAEMIVYNRKLTDCEILTINQYLGTKYGVTFTSATITAAGPTAVCAGASVNLTASAGSSYQWFKDNVQIPGATAATYTATTTGAYKVNITSAAGCTATSVPTQVTVNPLPTVSISSSVATPVCTNTPVTLTATSSSTTGATNITWSPSAGLNTTSGSVVIATPNTTITYTATARDVSTLCASTATYTVVVNPIPTVNDIANVVICNGTPVPAFIPSGTISGASYSWTNTNNNIGLSASGTGTIPSFNATNTTNAPLVSTVTVTASTATDEFGYVTNYGSNNVSVINLRTNTNVATIPVGQLPYGVAVSADKKMVYVANYGSNTISVIDATANTVSATITTGMGPKGVILSKDGNSIYVTHREEENVRVYSTATLTETAVISLGNAVYKYSEAGVLSPDGSKLYVVNGNNRVFIINTQTNTLAGSISVGYDGRSIAINQDGSRLYVTSRYPNNVLQVINTTTNSVIQNIPVGNAPYAFALTPDGQKAFVAHFSSFDVHVVDVINYTTLAIIPIGGNLSAVSMSTDGTKVYVSGGTNRFNIIDASTFELTKLSSSLVGSISYSVGNFTLAGNAGCVSAPKTYTITVNPTPVVTASTNTQTICSGASISPINFSSNTTGQVTYTWERDQQATISGSIPTSGTGDIAGNLINTSSSPVTVEFTVTPTAANCTGTPIKVYVTVNPVVTATATTSPQSCSNSNDGTIVVSASGASSFEYSINNGASFVSNNTFTNLSAGNYSIVVRSASGCISAAINAVVGVQPDVTAPVPNVATLPDITGQCAVTVTTVPTATDNCSGIRTATTTSPLNYNNQGTYTITWRYTDAAGNVSTQTQKVIVKDDTPPVVSCPAPITVVNTAGQCGAVVTYAQPVVSDNCASGNTGVHTLAQNAQFYDFAQSRMETSGSPGLPMSFFPTDGQKMAVFLVSCGASHYMYQDITLPTTGPIQLGFDMKYTNHNGSGFSASQFIAVEIRNATTNAILQTLFKTNPGAPQSTPMTHYTFDLSAYAGQTVRLEVIDATINNFFLDVLLDNVTIPGSTLQNGSFETGNYTGWQIGSAAGSSCGIFGIGSGPSVTVVQTTGLASGSLFPIGTTTNTFEVTDLVGNKTTCSFDVTVNAPEIKLSGNDTEIVRGDVTPATTDNTDFGGTTPGATISKTFEIANTGTSALTISSINISNANFVRSGITLPMTINPGQSTTFSINFNTLTLGVQNATVTINNNDCNEAAYTFAVKAEITCTNPVFSNVNIYIQNNTTTNSCNAIVNYPLAVSGIPAPAVNYTFSGATTGSGTGTGSGQTFNTGITRVVVTATNACTTATTEFDVTVVDNVKPVVVTKNMIAYLNAAGQVTINPTDVNNGSADNCGPVTLSLQNTGIICATAAEGSSLTLTAPAGTVITAINFASYGTPTGSCGNFVLGACHASNSKSIVEGLALNKNSVTIAATNGVFGDPCGGTVKRLYVTATYSGGSTPVNTFDCSKLGENTVTLIVTDANGNSNTGTAVVTVVDNIAPTVATQNITVQLAANGTANITPAQINNGSFDNCSISSYVLDKTSFNCTNVGANNVTLTVTDRSGNVSTATAVVTVQDNIAPTAKAQNITVQLDANGAVTITPAQINNGSFDNCSIASYSLDKTNFDCSNVGANNVILTVTDANGNVSTATAVVTVQDNIAPTAKTQNITIQLDANGAASVTAAQINDGSFDNCSIASYSLDKTSFSCNNVGANTVVLTVTDINGNVSTATAVVTVQDNIAPTITAPATINQGTDAGVCGATVNLGTPITADNCSVASVTNNAPALFPVGSTTVTWTVTDANGNVTTATQTVVIADTEKPTITAPAAVEANNTPGLCTGTVTLGTPVTADNCGVASVTNNAPTLFPVGTTTVTWTVTDVNGNTTTTTQTVVIVDNEKPTIAAANINVNNDAAKCGASITIAQPITADNCGVATVMGVRSDNALLSADYPVGTTTITWTVRDIHGNMNATVQTIVVTDNEKPVIACAANQVFCANTGGNTQYTIPALSQSDNCGIASTTYTVTGATNRNGTGTDASGSFAIGTSTVTFTVTDIHGNVSTCSFTVIINPLPVASIAASNADALCNQLVLTGNSTLNGPFTYQWLYNSTTKASTQQLSLGLTDADGIYSLYTTNANGCRSELAATYNYQKQNLISSYTILATKEVKLGQYNKVETGSVGVTSSKGEAEFKKYSSVTGAGAFVKAREIDTDKGVTIANKIYAAATVTLPTMQYNTTTTRYLQNVTVNSNTTTTLSGNYNDVTLKKGSNVTLNGTIFGRIKLEEGANVRFTSSTINLEELQIEKGPKSGGYSYIRFAPNTSVRVSKKVTIGSDVIVNPEQYQVTFYMADNRRDEEKFHVKGDDTRITANIFLPDGKLKVTGGNYGGDDDDDRNKCDHRAHSSKDCKHKGHGHHDCDHKGHGDRDCRDEVYMTGLFIAEEVESEGKHIIWNNYSCSTPPAPVTIATANTSTTTVTEETAKFPATAITATTEAELKVTVMPNPSRTYFTLKIESKYEAPVTMRVVDATGRVIDSRTKIGANSTIQIGHNYNTGNYFAELIQGNRRKVIQLIKIK